MRFELLGQIFKRLIFGGVPGGVFFLLSEMVGLIFGGWGLIFGILRYTANLRITLKWDYFRGAYFWVGFFLNFLENFNFFNFFFKFTISTRSIHLTQDLKCINFFF